MTAEPVPPRVLVPLVPLQESEATRTVLTTVELWPDRVHVRAVVLPRNDASQKVSASERLPALSLSDSAGTSYELSSGSAGGTDTEEALMWTFRPGVPTDLDDLTVSLNGRGSQPVRLML